MFILYYSQLFKLFLDFFIYIINNYLDFITLIIKHLKICKSSLVHSSLHLKHLLVHYLEFESKYKKNFCDNHIIFFVTSLIVLF
jgi:hypothetical protein